MALIMFSSFSGFSPSECYEACLSPVTTRFTLADELQTEETLTSLQPGSSLAGHPLARPAGGQLLLWLP